MKSGLRLFSGAVLIAFAAAAHASIAYNNFGAGDSFNTGGNWSDNQNQFLAMPFTSATTGQVSLVTVALFTGANYTAHLELADNGLMPGTILESWTFAGTGAAQSLAGNGTASLVNGANYWLEIDPAGPTDNGAWYTNSIGATGTFIYTNAGNWNNFNGTLSVFRVETNAVPEPVSMLVLGIGALGVGLRRRARR
jgi:hypothetical protein